MSNMEHLPADFLQTFIRHIKMFRFIGLKIFSDKGATRVRKYGRLCVFNALFLPMVAGQVLHVARGVRARDAGGALLDVANSMPTTLMALQDAVKMVVIFLKRNELQHVITGIAGVWPTRIQSDENRRRFAKWLRRLKLVDDTFFVCSVVFIMVYESAPLLRTALSARAATPVRYLFPLQCSFLQGFTAHWQYALGYFYLFTTSVTTHMVLYISSDFLLITLTVNLSTLVDLLQKDLEDAVSRYEPHNQQTVQDVKAVIARHQKLLSLAKELSEIFGLLVFVQVSFSSIIICCFGFLTVIAEGVLNNLLAALGVVLAMCDLCWPAQLLADTVRRRPRGPVASLATSSGVSAAAYASRWYDKDVALRRCIAIIMTRAQRPCYLTVFGFSNLQLSTFFKILSTSWSYLSLLNQAYRDSGLH